MSSALQITSGTLALELRVMTGSGVTTTFKLVSNVQPSLVSICNLITSPPARVPPGIV